VYFDSYENNVDVACLERLQSLAMIEKGSTEHQCRKLIDVCAIEYGLKCLKAGKASGLENLCKENILYAHPIIITYLTNLFNMILMRGFVPDNFGLGVTVPVVKDKLGDVTAASNYRPITLSPVICKICEYCIVHQYEHLLSSDTLQFVFKKNMSCLHAIFVLMQSVDYFVRNGSDVFMSSLDARKAFDRVNHVKLFDKLIDRGFLVC